MEGDGNVLHRALCNAVNEGNNFLVGDLIISERADVNAPIIAGERDTALHVAVRNGDDSMVETLLEIGSFYSDPLHLACELGFDRIVSILCRRYGNYVLNGTRHIRGVQHTPLQTASFFKNAKCVEVLCELGADVNYASNDNSELGGTALHVVLCSGTLEAAETIIKILLRFGANFDARGPDGMTALHLACKNGFSRIAKLLLDNGASVNELDDDGKTSLYVACGCKNGELVCLLLEHGASVNGVDRSPLHLTSEKGYVDIMEILINNGASLNQTDGDGNTPLHKAFGSVQELAVRFLLEKGASVNIVDQRNASILHVALEKGHLGIAKTLVNYGASVNQPDNNGIPPLVHASTCGQKLAVQFLLEEGASVNAVSEDEFKVAPLHVAAEYGHTGIIHMLLNKGANVDLLDGEGCSPICLAAKEGYIDAFEVLLEYGANPRNIASYYSSSKLVTFGGTQNYAPVIRVLNTRNIFGSGDKNVALLQSAVDGSLHAMEAWLDIGADINYVDDLSCTALHYASEKGNANCVEFLLRKGVDIEIVDARGRTALVIAAESGETMVAKTLLESGADVHAVDTDGASALTYACAKGFACMVQLLLEYEAGVATAAVPGQHFACRTIR